MFLELELNLINLEVKTVTDTEVFYKNVAFKKRCLNTLTYRVYPQTQRVDRQAVLASGDG